MGTPSMEIYLTGRDPNAAPPRAPRDTSGHRAGVAKDHRPGRARTCRRLPAVRQSPVSSEESGRSRRRSTMSSSSSTPVTGRRGQAHLHPEGGDQPDPGGRGPDQGGTEADCSADPDRGTENKTGAEPGARYQGRHLAGSGRADRDRFEDRCRSARRSVVSRARSGP